MISWIKCWFWYAPRNIYYGWKWKRKHNNFKGWFDV